MVVNPWVTTHIFSQIIKFCLLSGVLVCLLIPTPIHRENLKGLPEGFQITFTKRSFPGGKYFFCKVPQGRAMTVTNDEVLKTLNLPNNTQVDKSLRDFAECDVKAKKLGEGSSVCYCTIDGSFIAFICICLLSMVVCMVKLLSGPPKKSQWSKVCNGGFICCWVAVLFLASFNLLHPKNQIKLDQSQDFQNYYQHVANWWLAIGFGGLHCLLVIMETIWFYSIVEGITKFSLNTYKVFESLVVWQNKEEKEMVERYANCREVSESQFTFVRVSMKTWP